MSSALVCSSHSPLMYCYARPPDCQPDIDRLFAEHAEAIKRFDPELVIMFGPDHFNGFHLKVMPPFCVGLQATAESDIGGFPGKLTVPGDIAVACVAAVRAADVDVAVSYDMVVDHGFSQTLTRVLGGLDRRPTLPIFVNGIAPPFVPFRRTRLLGEAVGRFAAGLGKRVLFLASGGMSHHPTRYYPAYGTGEPAVTGWQLNGGKGEGLTREEWLTRLDVLHREGAPMLIDGRRTRADIMLNPEVDRQFMDAFTGDLQQLDRLDPAEVAGRGGVGILELHAWIAAIAAHRAAGGAAPKEDLYAETMELGIAFGMVHSY